MNRFVGKLSSSHSSSVGRVGLAMVGALVLVLGGCQSGPIDGSGVQSRQFQDVVVPDGFRLQDRAHESYSREEATWRQGHFVYLGSATVDEASGYVLQRMPHHSWQMVGDASPAENGMRVRFERDIYSADYQFTRRDGLTMMVVDYATDYSKR